MPHKISSRIVHATFSKKLNEQIISSNLSVLSVGSTNFSISEKRLKLYQGIIMSNLQSIKKTSQSLFDSINHVPYFPCGVEYEFVFQNENGIFTSIENERAPMPDVNISIDGNATFLTINVSFNSKDIDNSATVSFHSDFSELFCADSETPPCLIEAEKFLYSICDNEEQEVVIQTMLFGLVSTLLFKDVTESSLVAVALMKSMVKRDLLNAVSPENALLKLI